jgi:hypothetical protein
MSGWKGEEENESNIYQEWILRVSLKSQGTLYLPEDLQDVRKEDGAT